MMVTLADRVRELFEERIMWLREPPADMPGWSRAIFEAQRPGRLERAAEIDAEVNEAIALMRELGWLPQRGEELEG